MSHIVVSSQRTHIWEQVPHATTPSTSISSLEIPDLIIVPRPPKSLSFEKICTYGGEIISHTHYAHLNIRDIVQSGEGRLAFRTRGMPDSCRLSWYAQRALVQEPERVPNIAEVAYMLVMHRLQTGGFPFSTFWLRTSSLHNNWPLHIGVVERRIGIGSFPPGTPGDHLGIATVMHCN